MPVIEQTAGYWGEVTASVDWCEPNYAWTPFVAEFWNTISSLAMIGVGLMGLVLNRKVMDLAFTFVFASIIMGKTEGCSQAERYMGREREGTGMGRVLKFLLCIFQSESDQPCSMAH